VIDDHEEDGKAAKGIEFVETVGGSFSEGEFVQNFKSKYF
jgi:hypothetical protein